jgi:TRAP-type C4-dicarboxylate transport system substrate-binding protein
LKKLLFISLAVVLALSVGLIGCEGEGEGEVLWDDVIYLDMHCTISDRASIVEEIFIPWVDDVHTLVGPDGGTFNITVTYGEAPFSAATSLNGISSGAADIGQLSPETFNLGGSGYLPFYFDSCNETAYVMYNLWTENDAEWDANGELSQVKILLSAPLWGSQLWSTTESGNMTVASTWSGVKHRTDAQVVESDTISSLGAIPVYLGVADLPASLDSGVVNSCFFTYSGIGAFAGLGESTEYTTELNCIYRPYALAINLDSYNDLPADAQAALDSVSGLDKSVELATRHAEAEAGDRWSTESGTGFGIELEWGRPIYVPTPSEMDDYKAATANVDDWWAGNVTILGLDGDGILARMAALKTAFASYTP